MNKLFSLSRRAICLENKIYFNSCCKLSNIQSKFSLSHLTASKEPTPDISVAQVCSVSYNSKRLYSASKKTSKGKNEVNLIILKNIKKNILMLKLAQIILEKIGRRR